MLNVKEPTIYSVEEFIQYLEDQQLKTLAKRLEKVLRVTGVKFKVIIEPDSNNDSVVIKFNQFFTHNGEDIIYPEPFQETFLRVSPEENKLSTGNRLLLVSRLHDLPNKILKVSAYLSLILTSECTNDLLEKYGLSKDRFLLSDNPFNSSGENNNFFIGYLKDNGDLARLFFEYILESDTGDYQSTLFGVLRCGFGFDLLMPEISVILENIKETLNKDETSMYIEYNSLDNLVLQEHVPSIIVPDICTMINNGLSIDYLTYLD